MPPVMSQITTLLITIIHGYAFLLFIWVLLSWIPDLRFSKLYRFLDRIFVPFLEPFKRVIPPINGIDISPILALFTLQLITSLLSQLL